MGNLDAKRDEGYSNDYVNAMWLMLQNTKPEDFVIATGETHSCMEWLELTLEYFELTKKCVALSDDLIRPNEINTLIGNASKAKDVLGWCPKISYRDLNQKMCKYDYHKQSPDLEYSRQSDSYIF